MEFPVLEIVPLWGIRDPVSMGTHLLGALLGVVAWVLLLRRACRCGRGTRVRLSAYSLSMVLAFTASALFHATPEELVLFKKLDHAAIFLFIAGTTTAVYGTLQAPWVPRLLGFIWALTFVGILIKMVIWPMPLWTTAAVYIGLGLVASVRLKAFVRAIGWEQVRLLLWGGGFFIVGAVMFAAELPVLWPGVIEGHELFHVLVLLGTAAYFLFIYRHCAEPFLLCTPEQEEPEAEHLVEELRLYSS